MLRKIITRSLTQNLSTKAQANTNVPINSETKKENLQEITNKERSLNQVCLIGRVGQDPRVGGYNPENANKEKAKVVLFSVATNEYQGLDEQGNPKVRVDWHRIAVFGPRLQENCEKYVRQGDRVHVTGRIHYNFIEDKSGESRHVTSIVADDIIFLTKLQ